ncbi:MAG: 50S ribosomal protein L6 [Alphaproteobacteria bacterium]|nr:50S ribosomal protein L6 [Alphaproteobacteria bacterium]
MSKIGKNPVKILDGVNVSIAVAVLTAKGKLGEITVALPTNILDVEIKDGEVSVQPKSKEDARSLVMWGTIRALINNAVVGVAKGFEKTVELKGVGYKSALKGTTLVLTIGYSHEVEYKLPSGVKAEIVAPTEIKFTSANKELLGRTVDEITQFRKPDPYKGKGIRIKGSFVRRKEGKKK